MTKKYNGGSKSATTKPKKRTGRSPAIQFYFRQFIADEQVAAMDLETIGAHISLMCYAGASESRYRLAYNRHTIARFLRMSADENFDRIMSNLLVGAWKISKCGQYIEQLGLKRSFEKQKQYSALQSEKAKKRWENEQQNLAYAAAYAESMPKHMPKHMPSSASASAKDLNTKVLRSTNPHEKSHADLKEGDPGEKTFEAPANLPASATFSPAAPNKSKKKNPTLFDLKTSITREQYQSILSNPSLGGNNRPFLRFCVEQMADWSTSSGKSKLDWSAALRNWIRKTRQDGMTPENFESRINGKKSEAPKTFFELEEERHKNALASFLAKGEDNDKLN